jgi:hypothetical protein
MFPDGHLGLSLHLEMPHLWQSQARDSSDNPMLNAFCRVAPSVRFMLRAILRAGVFFLASLFISLISLAVQERRFFPFLISLSL